MNTRCSGWVPSETLHAFQRPVLYEIPIFHGGKYRKSRIFPVPGLKKTPKAYHSRGGMGFENEMRHPILRPPVLKLEQRGQKHRAVVSR